MESRNRGVWIFVIVAVLIVTCCCVAIAGAGAAWRLVGWPTSWMGVSGFEGEAIDQTFEVGRAPSLRVDNFAGSVSVQGGEGGEIRVVATKRVPNRGDLDRIEVEMVERDGGLLIRTRKPATVNSASVKLEITAPAGTYLDAHTGAGSVEASGLGGGAKLDTGAGSVTIQDLRGDVDVHTGAGSVEAYNIQGRLKVDTGSGSVTVKDMEGESDIHTGTGGIDMAGAAGRVRLDTGSGSIDYMGSPEGDCRFNTGTGSISLRLPADLDATVDLHTGTGSVEVGYAVDGQVSKRDVKGVIGSGTQMSIYAHTGSGSIDLLHY
jgi:DUF4097 and DUF4098 domain-containing protein YvlB